MSKLRTAGLNVKVLEDKEVLMHFGEKPAIDIKTGTFGPGWHSAGLEPADSTWTENREVTSNKTNLTAGQTTTSFTAGAYTGAVDLVPGSAVVDYIEWPDTVNKEGTLYRKHTSEVAKAYVARIHKFQSGVIGIKVSREKALLTISERGTTTDPTPRSLAIDYVNGGDEVMVEERYYHVGKDGTVAEVQPKIFQNIDELDAKIASGDAFVPGASESGLTAFIPVADKVGNATDGVTLNEFEDDAPGES
ncbi:hypothetical protein [Corynebacterium aurimucosum]|uniref:hypothetical protein n=1 Tax=Corynebacterium aurimucosum TaxID=169292 RepID=UPI001879150B|nr:hypothetical protein [Corynebacterium aurimucosum]MBE7338125.1 hypothetical protein [Corynebacterium aurimucosum]